MGWERMAGKNRAGTDRRAFLRGSGAAALATVGLAGCIGTENGDDSGGGGVPDTIVVGQPASVTGAWDFLQPAASAATDLAVQQINDAGGPLGSDFEVDRQDTAVETQQAREVVRQFADSDNVVAING